jgi:hypothetical protein
MLSCTYILVARQSALFSEAKIHSHLVVDLKKGRRPHPTHMKDYPPGGKELSAQKAEKRVMFSKSRCLHTPPSFLSVVVLH